MMITDICNAKKEELLSLPLKPFTQVKRYEYIVIVPTKRKHDSGWRLIALIGAVKIDKKYIPTELIGYCDDINWIFPENNNANYEDIVEKYKNRIRTDVTLSNCTRVWSDNHIFEVGCCTSSVDIKIIRTN